MNKTNQKQCISINFSEGLGIFDAHYRYPEIDNQEDHNGPTGKVKDIQGIQAHAGRDFFVPEGKEFSLDIDECPYLHIAIKAGKDTKTCLLLMVHDKKPDDHKNRFIVIGKTPEGDPGIYDVIEGCFTIKDDDQWHEYDLDLRKIREKDEKYPYFPGAGSISIIEFYSWTGSGENIFHFNDLVCKPITTPSEPFVVKGKVEYADGKPYAGGIVRVFAVNIRTQKVGEEKTKLQGQYEIQYSSERFRHAEKGGAKLRVCVMDENDNELVCSNLQENVPAEVVIDLILPIEKERMSECERLYNIIQPLLRDEDLPLAELNEKDIDILAKNTGEPRERIAFLAAAAKTALESGASSTHHKRRAGKSGRYVIPVAAFYGWFRQGLPTSLPELQKQNEDVLRRALETSLRDNIIPAALGDAVESILARLQQVAAEILLKPGDIDGKASLGDLLGTVLPDSEKQLTFANLFISHQGTTEAFWKALQETPDFDKAEIGQIQTTLQMGTLTSGHMPLVRELQRMGQDDPELNEMRGFARLELADWVDIISRPQEKGQPIGFPQDVQGEDESARIKTYAANLNQFIEKTFPTAVISHRLDKDDMEEGPLKEARADFKTFFANNPAFEFGGIPVDLYLSKDRDQKLKGVKQPGELILQLKNMDRVFKITPSYPEIRPLLVDDLHSATAMVYVGERRFTEKYAQLFGGQIKAREVFRKAEHVHATALNVYMKHSVTFNSPLPYVISGKEKRRPVALDLEGVTERPVDRSLMADDRYELPEVDWRTLFGSLDLCDCQHCRSLYSPAAYLVDTLKFLDNCTTKKDGKSPLQVLLARRPDIANTELTCENTNTPLPYVDLVNEVLEEALMPPPIGHWDFDEGQGKIAHDASFYANNGTLKAHRGSGPTWQPGKIGTNSLSFDGNFDYVQVPANKGQILTDTGSICAWIYPKGVGSLSPRGTIIAKEGEFVILWQLSLKGGAIDWSFPNRQPSEQWHAAGGYIAPVNEWTHIAVVFDKGKVKTYANGELVDDASGTGSIRFASSQPKEITIGGRPDMGQYFYGLIDDVRLYDGALNNEEVLISAEARPRRQTRGTAEELASNPEYINTSAYDWLSKAVYPWSLPLNLWVEEARVYLNHVGVQRHEVMETFFKRTLSAALTDNDIALEYIGLTIEEAKIIECTTTGGPSPATPNPGAWNFWGLLETENDIIDPSDPTAPHATGDWDGVLSRVSIFLQQSSLSYKELLELLGTDFINPDIASGRTIFINPASIASGRIIGIVSTDPTDSATCHLSKLEIKVLVDNTTDPEDSAKNELIAAWSRIHRFVRLWRKIGWTMRDLDKAIIALQPKDIYGNLDITDNGNFLVQLSHIQRLRTNLNVPLVNIMSWLAKAIDTTSYIDHLAGGQPEVKSLYEQLFQNRTAIKLKPGEPDPFELNSPKRDELAVIGKISEHVPDLLGALGISAAELSLLTATEAADDKLNLSNLSHLYRIVSFSRALKLPIKEFFTVKTLIGIDPFEKTKSENTLFFVEKVRKIRDSGFSIPELDYLLWHRYEASSGIAPTEESVALVLDEIRTGLKRIIDETAEAPDPMGELVAKKLTVLGWESALIAEVMELLKENTVFVEQFDPGIANPTFATEFNRKITERPEGKITYDGRERVLRFTGVMKQTKKTTLLGLDPAHQAYQKAIEELFNAPNSVTFTAPLRALPENVTFPPTVKITYDGNAKVLRFVGVMKQAEQNTLLGLSTDQNDPAHKAYQDAINKLFDTPNTLTYIAQLNALPAIIKVKDIPAELEGRITYSSAKLHSIAKLRFQGAMSEAEKETLQEFFTDTEYQGVIEKLFEKPRTFVKDQMKCFTTPTYEARLDTLPKNVNFPASIKISYDSEATMLQFVGVMTPLEKETLLGLSTDQNDPAHKAYQDAINKLFDVPNTYVPDESNRFLTATDAGELFNKASPAQEKFDYVLARINKYLRLTGSESLVKLKLSENLKADVAVMEQLLTRWKDSSTDPNHRAMAVLLDPFFSESRDKVTAVRFPSQFTTFRRLDKVATIISRLSITHKELPWLLQHSDDTNWLIFNTLPTDASETPASFTAWERLVDIYRLRDALPTGKPALFEILDKTVTFDPVTGNAAKSKFLDNLSKRTEWKIEELEILVGKKDKAADTGILGFTFPRQSGDPKDYKDDLMLLRLSSCFKLMKRLGASAKLLVDWKKPDLTFADARSIKNIVRAKYDDKQWLEVAKPLKDTLREKQRAALVAYLITHPDPFKGQNWGDVNELYEYFLIDVEMSPCMMTTRIKQAISSVQLFIQRCLMNLENNVALTPEDAKMWSQWRKWYRVWEANRKVLLYPENWIEPELRDDKSPFYKDLENELLQSDVTMDTAEDAFLHYLEKLDQVARLEIVGMYQQQETGDIAQQLEPIDILHVFGRTYAIPHIYFYRRLKDKVWSAWEKLEVDIEGDHLIPVAWNRRLYLFWAIFTEKSEQPTKTQRQNEDDPNKYWEIKLAWSEYKNERWSSKKVSKKFLRHNKYPFSPPDVPQVPPLDVPQDPKDFSFKTRIGEQLSIQCYGTTVTKGVSSTKTTTSNITVNDFRFFVNLSDKAWYSITFIHPINASTFFLDKEVESIHIKKVIAGRLPLEDKIYEVPTFAPNDLLQIFTINPNGTIKEDDGGINQPSDFYLESTRFSVESTNVLPATGTERKWYVTVKLKYWSKPNTKEVSTTTNETVPGEIPNPMWSIGEFTLDGCNGDLVPMPSASLIPSQLIPIPATKFEGMALVDQNTQDAMISINLLAKTPGTFRLLGLHQRDRYIGFVSPYFYQDDLGTYFVANILQPPYQLLFSSFYHPRICNFIKSLNRFGIRGLLTLANQRVSIGDHFYTTNIGEWDNDIIQYGNQSEGIACYVFDSQVSGTIPLYRLFNEQTGDHFYTTDIVERNFAIYNSGYYIEGIGKGIACFVYASQVSGTTSLYRLFSSQTGDHFYTTSTFERDDAIAQSYYQSEGIACYVFDTPVSGSTPLYRLINQQIVFNQKYKPGSLVGTPRPIENVDFENGGAYSLYNWELFFHTPFLIAMQLSKNQRFEEAQKWFHYIFDPTATDSPDMPGNPGIERFWRVKPFYDEAMQPIKTLEELIKDVHKMEKQVEKWEANPFQPHVIASMRVMAYMKAVVMRYIDNLIAWGDQLFRRETIESINEATQLYILAAQILGKRPESIPARAKAKIQTFHTLDDKKLDSLSNAMVEIESFLPPSAAPTSAEGTQGGALSMPFFCIPGNDKLLGYWDTVADRLFKIRHCMNIEGVERSLPIFEPKIDPALLVRAAAAGIDISSALNDINAAVPHYRFNVMMQKASELCNDVKALGGAFLLALEKRDAEELALLRSTHEVELLQAIRNIKVQQIEEAKNTHAGLLKYQDVVTARQLYYQSRPFMNAFEIVHMALTTSSLIPMSAQIGAEMTAAVLHMIPDTKLGFTTTAGTTLGGSFLASAVQAFGSAAGTSASTINTTASLSATLGGYQRRQEDWAHQADLATKELKQVEKQITAADIRLAISDSELINHDKQIENAKEVDEYMRDKKFTNQQLYSWMVGQLSGIYFQSYQLAYDVAKRAERTYRFELGLKDSNFIKFGHWDSLKKGLLSGEGLYRDLKNMELAYLDQNKREYEITKYISLITIDPIRLVELKETGECFVSLPEALFDIDYPGHYLRRIKSVSITIPCVTGPYTGVNCTLTQLSSTIRHANTLLAGKYARAREGEDMRFSDTFSTIQSIVTSSGQNDSGLFEANLRDERYLPFEGQGAISTWRIQLPTQFKSFDYDTISDVVLHLRYTAREGGALLKQNAERELQNALDEFIQSEGQGLARIFSLRHEFSSEWYRFLNPQSDSTKDQMLIMDLGINRFPFLFRDKSITITDIELFVKIKPEFTGDHNESTVKLALAAGATAPASGTSQPSDILQLVLWNGLLHTSKKFNNNNPPGSFTLNAWLNTDKRLDPDAIQDILVVCRYTCP